MENSNAALWLIDQNIARGNANAAAIRFRRTTYSYDDVMRSTWRVQNTLRELGVRQGERVIIFATDGPDMIAWVLGCLRSGVTAVPVSSTQSDEEVGDIARDAAATLLVVSASFRFHIDAVVRRTPSLFQAIVIDNAGRLATSTIGGPTVVSWADFVDDSPTRVVHVRPDSSALFFYRYGPESTRQHSAISHGQICSFAETYANIFEPISSVDRVFGLPMMHTAAGIHCSLVIPFGLGATVVVESGRSASVRGLCEVVASESVTTFFLDRATARKIVDSATEPSTLASLRTAVFIGEAGDEFGDGRLRERFNDRFGTRVVDIGVDLVRIPF
jgi:acyl-coenzyme A synthetase/AMP-(fatty) acid ligase